jgi:hypothetical protein
MTDKIEYYKLSKYIKTELINNIIKNNSKISGNLIGGSNPNPNDNDSDEEEEQDLFKINNMNNLNKIKAKFLNLINLDKKEELIKQILVDEETLKKENNSYTEYIFPILFIIAIYNNKNTIGEIRMKYIITISICYLLFLIYIKKPKNDLSTSTLKEDLLNVLKDKLKSDLKGGSGPIVSGKKSNYTDIIKGAIGVTILYYISSFIETAFVEFKKWFDSPNKTVNSFFKMLMNIMSNSTIELDIVNSYSFNESTGMLECAYKKSFNTIITKLIPNTEKCYLGEIEMTTTHDKYTKKNKITYIVNSMVSDTVTYIESKPVSTALVMTYLCAKKEQFYIKKNPQDYIYEITSDNIVKLYDKKTEKEIMSVSVAIKQFKDNLEEMGNKTMDNICKDVFKLDNGLKNENCLKHYLSILSGTGLLMLQNIGEIVKKNIEIKNTLKNTNPLIKYEILKNLKWKMKKTEYGKKYLITVEDWLKKMNNLEFTKYLDSENGLIVKDIIKEMIEDINTNTSILEEKYTKIITNANYNNRKNKSRLKKIKNI